MAKDEAAEDVDEEMFSCDDVKDGEGDNGDDLRDSKVRSPVVLELKTGHQGKSQGGREVKEV